MLFLGFSAGLPLLLIFSSISLWLREAGVERSVVTLFSWAALGYSFKFVWAPLVDCLPLPLLTRLMGRRRSWLLLSQISVIIAILWMASIDPSDSDGALQIMAMAAVFLGFSSATQDIVIDAYRIESDTSDMQALLSSTYIAGYRTGMIVAGAGALYLASYFGTTKEAYSYSAWMWTYIVMAMCMLVGIFTTLIISEPRHGKSNITEHSTSNTREHIGLFAIFILIAFGFAETFYLSGDWIKLLKQQLAEFIGNGLAGFILETLRLVLALGVAAILAKIALLVRVVDKQVVDSAYLSPVKDFFSRYGKSIAVLLLLIIGLYRISDIVLGVISNVFYQDLGFTKIQIADVSKVFGVIMAITGGVVGGVLSLRFGVMKILFLGAVLSAVTNLLFILLAKSGANLAMLYMVIGADNLSAGIASAAFVAFLSGLVNISFTATQFAIFTSLMTLLPKLLGGYSGSMVDVLGYPGFFTATALMGIPVLVLIWIAGKKLEIREAAKQI